MANISSPGIGTNGLDVKSIISQLVALERQPLDTLKLQAATVRTEISAIGQIKSLVATLSDAAGRLSGAARWDTVSASSSDAKQVSATALDTTPPTSFTVEVQHLAQAQSTASAALLPVGAPVGAGRIRLLLGRPDAATPVDIDVSATDRLKDVVRKINAADAGVTASVLSDASGERLLLRGKATGLDAQFSLTVTQAPDGASGLSRLGTGNTVTQAAADARATVNGIAVSSATNTFAATVEGVTFTAHQVTTGPVEITVRKDDTAVQSDVDALVKAYNAVNQLLQEATKYDAQTRTAGLLQGDSTVIALHNALRRAIDSDSAAGGAFQYLADIGVTQQLGGDLAVDPTRLAQALEKNPEGVKTLFSGTNGVALRVQALGKQLLSSDGFFQSKANTLSASLNRNDQSQAQVNAQADAFEQRITQRYTALDKQLSSLNALNAYITQQVATWNKQ
ncbi:flagellar cap protein FliD [Verminephrobacter aporrectodeae subsp. tuberculatae]|uniref:Flagellar hook-associated protein 2 n=1 Tax=Verminephrobacter aporrectodeae subsp. tuberculatae TaxID=1110392 RepID=A0ABT3KT61_9BURK|nr:flagellar filament capping protein FliD [Verminephrobacter aporrectodeae]MCW5222455.1 flagellar cap protein FliD [Verminephrobacter aporrectodeae subsp. tuberculatae]MCW5257338.1 flagellar cap protein FliD [Verminephrobacter aporrectodeae subsp. tuberculatae]MCW5287920.1 flagellar cap protein FliD [Verminephrobacter aporrectodeae subsp. tuberculatae]MCW5321476.1 flagellar cap protein FliD [Verminephrobacter aporrectodeae subsp. tuberculatae]